MIRIAGRLLFPLLLVFLVGCAARMKTDVTRFHQMPPPAGETVEIKPMNPAYQNSLEFNQYADLVGAKLKALGYQPPVKGKAPDFIAHIDYGVMAGPAPLRGSESPVSVGVGVSGGSHHTGLGVGISKAFGSSGDSGQQFTRWFGLIIDRAAGNIRLFEGRASSQGKTADLGRVMPYLVDAMFTDFPGQNGATKTVTVDVPE